MRYYKLIENGYCLGVGIGDVGIEITEEEYKSLLDIILNHPEVPEGCGYCLKEDLTWELCELPPIVEEAEEADYMAALERFGVE